MRLASKYSLPFATGTKSRLFSRQGAGLYASSTLYASSLSQTRTIVIGRASPPHTKAYVKTSNSSLFHKIEVPGLYINPFIVQPSHRYQGKSTRDQFIQFEHSVRTHKANCFCIYRHDGVQSYNDWYFHHMDPLLGRNKLRREDVILMAKVGVSVFPHQNIQTQLEQIKARCGISHVDIIILEVYFLTNVDNSFGCFMSVCIIYMY